jgi:putative endonuclease
MAFLPGADDLVHLDRAAQDVRTWLTRNDWARSRTWRADAVFIAPRRWPQHIVSAFELEMR